MASYNSLGKRIRRLRRARGLTQERLAARARIAYSTLSKIEQGKIKAPSAAVLARLVKVLQYDLDDLLSGKPLPTLSPLPPAAKPKVKFVYIDVHGVLVRWQPGLQAFSSRIHRPYHDVNALFWTYNQLACLGKLNFYDLQLLYLLKYRIKYRVARAHKLFRHWSLDMEPIIETHELAIELASTPGVQIGLLTNIIEGFYEQYQRRSLVPDLPFKTVIQSCEVGMVKPDPNIYLLAQAKAKVAPEEILLIDDTKINIKIARQMGWQAEWFNEFNPAASIARIKRKYF